MELALDDYSRFHERDRTEAELITHLEELCSPGALAWRQYGVVHIQGTPVVSVLSEGEGRWKNRDAPWPRPPTAAAVVQRAR